MGITLVTSLCKSPNISTAEGHCYNDKHLFLLLFSQPVHMDINLKQKVDQVKSIQDIEYLLGT